VVACEIIPKKIERQEATPTLFISTFCFKKDLPQSRQGRKGARIVGAEAASSKVIGWGHGDCAP
jgi:starvation-inducible outer membrane lipoprotein